MRAWCEVKHAESGIARDYREARGEEVGSLEWSGSERRKGEYARIR